MQNREAIHPPVKSESLDYSIEVVPEGDHVIRLRRKTEAFEANFELNLVSVPHRKTLRDQGNFSHGLEKAILKGSLALEINQRVDVVYRMDEHDCSCVIRGNSHAQIKQDAIDSANQLWRNLELSLAMGQPDYRFQANINPGSVAPNDLNWWATVRPEGLRIAAKPAIGYLNQADGRNHELLVPYPQLHNRAKLDALTDAASKHGAPMELALSITPFSLEAAQESLIESLTGDSHSSIGVFYTSGRFRLVQDQRILDAVWAELEKWRQHPVGFRVQCLLLSDRPIPNALLRWVGDNVFHSRPVAWYEGTAYGNLCRKKGPSLDLRDAVHAGGPLPTIVPGVDTLVNGGISVHYADTPPNLSSRGTKLGFFDGGRKTRDVYLTTEDRARHCYILGQTGTGKSTLLYNMLVQDIKNGVGVCVIDPHGDLYKEVLASVPEHRLKDLVLVEPDNFERTVGVNFLECGGAHLQLQMNFIVNGMMSILDQLYDLKTFGGPVFEQYMRNALLLVMDNKRNGGTLLDIPLLFEDDAYRKHLIDNCHNPYTVSFWQGQAERARGDHGLKNIAGYITSKLNQFTHNALLRPIIGQSRSTINFRECMDAQRILLVNLPKGLLGELDTRLLGMLIIGKLFGAALQRVTVAKSTRRPFYLYVDDAQNFVTPTVAHLLAEARKFGLHLTMANQNLAQVRWHDQKSHLMASILGNVGTLMFFRLGSMDAEYLASYLSPELSPRDVEDLPNYHVAGRILANGRPTRPFVFQTCEPSTAPEFNADDGQLRQEIVTRCRSQYTRRIAEVEEEILARRLCSYKSRVDTLERRRVPET